MEALHLGLSVSLSPTTRRLTHDDLQSHEPHLNGKFSIPGRLGTAGNDRDLSYPTHKSPAQFRLRGKDEME